MISQKMPAIKNVNVQQQMEGSYDVKSQHVFLHDRSWTPAPKVDQYQGQITTAVLPGDCQAFVRKLKISNKLH